MHRRCDKFTSLTARSPTAYLYISKLVTSAQTRYKVGGKLPKLPGLKDGEQWYKVQLVLGYYWCISGIHRVHALSFGTDGMECPLSSLQVAQNCWSGVVDSLQAKADILMDLHTMEQCPGFSLCCTAWSNVLAEASWLNKAPNSLNAFMLQHKLLGWFSEALSRHVNAHTNNSSVRHASTLSSLFCFQVVIFIYTPTAFAVVLSSNILI